ncbi:MAG TPA: rhomboid family intramembrane serine protease [Longimicrobiales bacterium]|nr:rhomboid family intramembrane serine protease [Longimicrobiales bacterium]
MAYRGSFSFGFGLTPWVQRLIIANIGMFLLQNVFGPYFTMRYLAFTPAEILFKPWTLIAYMFAHGGFWHLALNMLALFFFGPPLEARWGSREFLRFYFICGLGGAVLSFLFAYNSPIIGASAAVYGIMLAFAMNWPDAPIYIYAIFPVKAKYLVGVMGMLSIFAMFQGGGDNIAHAAHLGGFAAGFLYLKFGGPLGPVAGFKRMMNRRRMKVVNVDEAPRSTGVRAPSPAARRRASGEEGQLLDELDRVLEKISTQGMSSLTPAERKLLDEVSRRYRTD